MVTTVGNESLRQGWNDFTASSEFSYDRWGQPQNIRIEDPTTGQFRALQQGESVPAGARFSVYTSETGSLTGAPGPAAGGQETVTGQDRVAQQHKIAMDLANAQDNMRALDQQDQQMQQQHQQFQAGLQQEREIAHQQAQQQAAQVGVQAAQQQLQARLAQLDNEARAAEHNFNQRLSRVQEERAAEQLNLERATTRSNQILQSEQLNAQQRNNLANLQQQGLGMLADRSGPQDWIRHQYLQENMLAPDEEGQTQVNPFKMLQDFYQPHEPDLKGLEEDYNPNLGGLVQEHQPGSTGGQWQGTLQDAVGQSQQSAGLLGGQAPQTQAPTSTRMGGQDPYPQGGGQQPSAGGGQPPGGGGGTNVIDPSQGIPNAGLEPGRNLVTVPEGGGIGYDRFDPRFDVYARRDGEYTQLGPGDMAQGGEPVWINTPQGYDPSGEPQPQQASSPAQNVMDARGSAPSGGQSYGPGNQPEPAPGSIMSVFPNAGPSAPGREDLRLPPQDQWTPEQREWAGNRFPNAPDMGNIPYGNDNRIYSHGEPSGPQDHGITPNGGMTAPSGQPLNPNPVADDVTTSRPGGGGYGGDNRIYSHGEPSGPQDHGIIPGQQASSDRIGNARDAFSSGSSVSAPTVESGAQLSERQRQMMAKYNQMSRMNKGGNLLEGQMAIVGDKPGGGRTGYEEAIVNTPQGTRVLDRHQTQGLLRGQQKPRRMATGGLLQSQDVGGADPDAFTFNQYSDEDMYNMPFLDQVRGDSQGQGFGAFGGGNRVGPFDLPTTPSMGTLSSLSPSALKMTQGAYESPGTGMYWDDIRDRARRASIGTQSTGGMSAFAGYR